MRSFSSGAGPAWKAWTADGELMAVEHVSFPAFGVQFHPESILTEQGYLLLHNFLRLSGIVSDSSIQLDTELVDARPARPALPAVVTF